MKKYFEDGHKIDPEGLLAASSLSERKKDEVFTSMETHGSSILKPVYEDLNKSVDYGELRILDRKSTRLNSSHVAISYAVFCLKKKKNTGSIIIHMMIQ